MTARRHPQDDPGPSIQPPGVARRAALAAAWSTPVIAAVNGTCAGGGLHFVADADIVIAGNIARNSPTALARTKRALWGALEQGLTDACRAGAAEVVAMWGHPDQTEGPLAFAEKREADWRIST